jgi:hypothetical protein
LVWSFHSALFAEILLSRLRIEIEKGASKSQLLRLFDLHWERVVADAPGYQRLSRV